MTAEQPNTQQPLDLKSLVDVCIKDAEELRELTRVALHVRAAALEEAARVCKDLDEEALAKEGRLACGAECAAAIADLAARMNVHCEVNHE